jgi:hypothetical protein
LVAARDRIATRLPATKPIRCETKQEIPMRSLLPISRKTRIWFAAVLLLVPLTVPSLQAATGRAGLTSASSLGLYVSTINRRLMVIGVTGAFANLGVRFGDQIVAVNGRRVAAEAAFLNRLTMAKRGSPSVTITVVRNGRLQNLKVPVMIPAPRSNRMSRGIMDPSQMVKTSQGVMHRDAAERLGLPGTPITGTPEWPDHPQHPGGGGFAGSAITRNTGFAGGVMDPSQMVKTSQGVMHRDAAARLGLPGTPISGTPEWPEHPGGNEQPPGN